LEHDDVDCGPGLEGVRYSTVVDGDVLVSFVAQVLVPQLKASDLVVLDNLSDSQPALARTQATPRDPKTNEGVPAAETTKTGERGKMGGKTMGKCLTK